MVHVDNRSFKCAACPWTPSEAKSDAEAYALIQAHLKEPGHQRAPSPSPPSPEPPGRLTVEREKRIRGLAAFTKGISRGSDDALELLAEIDALREDVKAAALQIETLGKERDTLRQTTLALRQTVSTIARVLDDRDVSGAIELEPLAQRVADLRLQVETLRQRLTDLHKEFVVRANDRGGSEYYRGKADAYLHALSIDAALATEEPSR